MRKHAEIYLNIRRGCAHYVGLAAGTSLGIHPRVAYIRGHRQNLTFSSTKCLASTIPEQNSARSWAGFSFSLRKQTQGRDEKAYQQTSGEGQVLVLHFANFLLTAASKTNFIKRSASKTIQKLSLNSAVSLGVAVVTATVRVRIKVRKRPHPGGTISAMEGSSLQRCGARSHLHGIVFVQYPVVHRLFD